MIDKIFFSEKIRFYRNKIGMTQTELAEKLHVSFQAISSWECGNTLPDLENLCALASTLGVSVDTLLQAPIPNDEQIFIGIDGGGTSTEFALFTSRGKILKCFKLQGTNASTIGIPNALSIFHRGIDSCLAASANVHGIFMGCAGGFLEDVVKKLSERYKNIPIQIDSDGVNALLSADGDAAMICGTGMVFFRHEPDGSYRKFAGWGHLWGDFGSAYNFGREAVCQAKAYEDGLDASSLMYALLKERLGLQSMRDSSKILKDVSFIAAQAGIVFEAYAQNDPYAVEILHREMERLSKIARGVCPNGGRIIACGGINQHYGNITLPVLRQYVPDNIEFVLPDMPPIYGACREACLRFGVTLTDEFYANFSSDYKKLVT